MTTQIVQEVRQDKDGIIRKEGGALVASILSLYDVPKEYGKPKYVSMEVANTTVETGPPSSTRQSHDDNFSTFKFLTKSQKQLPNGRTKSMVRNRMYVVSPLETLYGETVVFRVVFDDDGSKNLVAKVKLNSTLHLNETKWLVLDMPLLQQNQNQHSFSSRSNSDSTTSMTNPTIRLKMTLYGPYRPIIANTIQLAHTWFGLVDRITAILSKLSFRLPLPPSSSSRYNNIILLPLVPLLAVALVTSPIYMGLSIMLLPFLLPIMVIFGTLILLFILTIAFVFFSSKKGRTIMSEFISPLYFTMSHSPLGQRLLFDTGPILFASTTPKQQQQQQQQQQQTIISKLILSLLIDFIGSCSYLVPGSGELTDILWAPIQTMFLISMYNNSTTPSLKYISFLEEILPFTDIIPTGTIGWFLEYYYYSPDYLRNEHTKLQDKALRSDKSRQKAIIKQL